MTPEKLLENLYAIAYSLPEQERRFFCALEPVSDPYSNDTINAGHQLALLIRAIRTDMAQAYQRDDKRRTSAAAIRRIGKVSASKQSKLRPHFAGAFLDEQGRQCVTDGFVLLRLNKPSNALEWAQTPNDPHVYDTIPGMLNADGATVTLNLPTAAEVRAKIASDKAKFKAASRPRYYEDFSTCYNWGDGLPMVNALYLLDILEALPGCTAACRPNELSCVYFHSPDGDALIMPIRKYTIRNTDEQEEQE